MRGRPAAAGLLLLGLAGCHFFPHRGPPAPAVHYVVGPPYRSDGVWHYPRPQFDLDETGLAVATTRNSGLTADGEVADPRAMAAAHPSLQLPAVARITNLDTGLQVLVRVNDRGPAQRGRAIALTPRVFSLLGGAGRTVLRVRIQVQEAESRQLAAQLAGPEAPAAPVAAAPTGAVTSEALPAPPGVAQAAARPLPAAPVQKPAAPLAVMDKIPLRLPEQVQRVSPHPGPLYVELGAFGRPHYAEVLANRMAFLGAQAIADYDGPRDRAYLVRIGPLGSVAEADAMLARALQAGIAEARIVAE